MFGASCRRFGELQNVIIVEVYWKVYAKVGDSPVDEIIASLWSIFPSNTGHVKPCVNL